ncbi:MAG: TIR domain-containing protein [Flexilinea sp.]|nr:TIR domain-containing protein [Flexilinea sp.]
MSIFKCKMCGGTIEFQPGATVGVCDSCGTRQTLPRLDDDRRANLYDRANHFRRNNEFDKAMGIYEQILNEDNTDAEAYWSLVLCRYGIEYVEDPVTRRRIPTVNRAQFTSIFDDDNYQSALRYADPAQKALYFEEAQTINEIQKGILQISQKEEPFDVFICYKETDAAGRRTPDSVLANDLYHQLTQEGFKAFFSRITLENKLGTAYEPYIFAALNSAKVMVVLGTRPEYFNAVWVKNEWARYLALIKNGARKTLIPAYKDMDPYDLPDEFSHLQALDMSKLGFMQDLIRGIKKISGKDQPKPVYQQGTATVGSAAASSLLRRAFMFLEDGNWQEADQYCEKVLDMEPENAQAYLGKLMAELQVRTPDELSNQPQPFDGRNNYQKALRFGDEKLRGQLTGYITHIHNRIENDRLLGIYNQAVKFMNDASQSQAISQFVAASASYRKAAELFDSISGFNDSDVLAENCRNFTTICWKDSIYKDAMTKMNEASDISRLESAIKKFQEIPGWRDSYDQIGLCTQKINALKVQQEADRIRREQQEEARRLAAEAAAQKRKKIIAFVTPIVLACIVSVILYFTVLLPKIKFNQALNLIESGNYEAAYSLLTEIGKEDVITSNKYERAMALLKSNNYDEAYSLLKEIGKNDEIISHKYDRAMALLDSTDYEEAYKLLAGIGKEDVIISNKYDRAIERLAAGDYKSVYMLLSGLDYRDSVEILKNNAIQIRKELLKDAKTGDYVVFGSYEQDNNTSNGKEEIEWLVLDRSDNTLLLISKYALDCKQYNTKSESVTWETSSLRSWLNGTFLTEAFKPEEQNLISVITVSSDKNPLYSTDPGNSTNDKIFLLSINEVNRYFTSNESRQTQATAYAKAQGAYVASNGNSWWWLRSSGKLSKYAAGVFSDGSVSRNGDFVFYQYDTVRPALWINL